MCPLHILHDARYDCGIKDDKLGVGRIGEKSFPCSSLHLKALLRQILDGSGDGNKAN